MTILRKGEDKAKPNPFEEITPKDKEFLQEWTKLKDEELFSTLYKLKEKQLKHRGISFEDFKSKHLNKPFVDLKDLLSIGCLDGLDYLSERKHVNAEDIRESNFLVPNRGDNSATFLRQELNVENLLNNRFRPL